MKELSVLADIREALGCGHKPMQDELVVKVKQLVKVAGVLEVEHAEIQKFMAGFGKEKKCGCDACCTIREIFKK